jgi:hypothetical protein
VLPARTSTRWDREVDRHLDHGIGFTHRPTLGEGAWFRRVLRIAFLGAAVDPCGDLVDLCLREAPVIGKTAVLRVGEPRRHFADEDGFADGLGPRAGVLIGHQ